uniref:Uncharacterized protein n=1 Tax=Nelumbo nucifera TaxID=4432 RepID=A0A822XWH4_NELNU|nr:TPA_asm: hypothetical protein HUJ06_023211 [Nelumbo nucifera]
MEIEMDELFNDIREDGEVNMNILEVNGGHWTSGLIIQEMRLGLNRVIK